MRIELHGIPKTWAGAPPELELLRRCIAACFRESVSVPVLGQLHASIAREQQQQDVEKEEP